MKNNINISQISAELLLDYLYPELAGQWMPRHAGTFYRNYNSDVMALYPEEPTVVLSRDGLVQLLPQGLFAGEDKRQRALLNDAFLPVDAYWFNTKLQIELQVSQLLQTKLDYVLREYFQFDLVAQTNPYIRQAAVMLPFVRSKRGDFAFIRDVLSALTHCPISMQTGRYSDSDSSVRWLPRIRYTIFQPSLTAEQYNRMMEQLTPLFDFIRQWLIPVEIKSEFEIHEPPTRTLNNALTLNYNTQLKVEN